MSTATFISIALASIVESSFNPRRTFDEARLAELAESIKLKGVLQPILVRPKGDGYEIVAGARRFRAAQLAGIAEIPAVVRELSDQEALEAAVLENLQREDVSPLEEASAFKALMDQHGYDFDALCVKVGKPAAYVKGRLRLGGLGEYAREALDRQLITLGHAQHIATLTEDRQQAAVEFVIGEQVEGEPMSWRRPAHSGIPTAAQLKSYTDERLTVSLSGARWKLDDAKLLKQAGACATCPKRSLNRPSFFADEDAKDDCHDPVCFGKKLEVVISTEIKNGAVPLSVLYYSNSDGALASHEWTACNEGDEGAERGIIVERYRGDLPGEIVWFKRTPRSSSSAQGEKKGVTAERKEEIRQFRAESLARRRILDALLQRFDEDPKFGAQLAKELSVQQAIAVHVALRGHQQWNAPSSAAARPEPAKAEPLGFEPQEYGDFASWHLEKLWKAMPELTQDLNAIWKCILCACSAPEIPVMDNRHQPAIILEAFANVAGLDFELVRRECEWETLSKKQRAERLKMGDTPPQEPEPAVRTCRKCGCTEDDCSQCIEKTGRPCHWIAEDLCSACIEVQRLEVPETNAVLGLHAKLKAEHPDVLLAFQGEETYGFYLDDAETASEILGIPTLTCASDDGEACFAVLSVPAATVEKYLVKLIGAGHKVALVDEIPAPPAELEKPKPAVRTKKGGKK
jgi:ParB/RepB/Spo0J family partition protein